MEYNYIDVKIYLIVFLLSLNCFGSGKENPSVFNNLNKKSDGKLDLKKYTGFSQVPSDKKLIKSTTYYDPTTGEIVPCLPKVKKD